MSLKDRLNNWVTKRNAKTDLEDRLRQRKEVERQYAKDHPEKIVPVEPEYDQEFKLTHNGKFQLGSNGKLTQAGLIHRLKYRLNWAIGLLLLLLVILYGYFIFF